MSIDTITRVESYCISNIFTPNSYRYILESKNEALREEGSGEFVRLTIETFSDTLESTVSSSSAGRMEEGVVVLSVYDRKGSGTTNLYGIRDKITEAFQSAGNVSKQVILLPTGGEKGSIYFYEVSQRPAVDVNSSRDRREWRRLDVLVGYKKSYSIT